MATQQDEGGVLFAIAHELQQFRLLELPPEIVELIDAPNPPLLSIKSQPASPAATGDTAYAVLCTPDKSFQLRQVQTSNSVFITQSALDAHGNEIPVPVVRAIASCTATLELHLFTGSSLTYLNHALPIYDIIDGEVDAAGNGKSKAETFSHIPLSEGQCEVGWKELVAFEFMGSSYRPSPNTLSQVWKSVNSAALAEGYKLDSQFFTDDILKALDQEGYPGDLIIAMFRHLASDDQDTSGPWSCLDQTKTAAFVGQTLLAAKRRDADYLTADFLDTWKDHLPEKWRRAAELKTIDGAFILPSSTTIRAKFGVADSSTPKADSVSRKWHEKFGKTRKR
ncbi:sister chromatid cohesion protein Dcc1 [Massariosphaeria phaeospora]|uniref:Sister chromatid cohesion protein Dcc1 n=1 Tax=Massariosphaeria phaeospora TaxID=100035 RepID=A0A7C8MBL7_9PLEO|nr:sister chromatid cohesion protein Dcc1 [Massariosphaeria phaeospora]